VNFSGKSETFQVTGGARLNFHHYWGTPGLDNTDKILTLNSEYQPDPRDTLGLGVNSIQNSTLINSVTTTGVVEPMLLHNRLEITPSWSRYLTERTRLSFQYSNTRVNYANPNGGSLASVGVVDYRDQAGTMTTRYTLSERSALTFQVSGDAFNTASDSYRARTYGTTVGINYALSQTMRGHLDVGVNHTQSTLSSNTLVCNGPILFGTCFGPIVPLPTTIQAHVNTVTMDAGLTKHWQTRDLSLDYTRAVVPSGVGSLIEDNVLNLSLSNRLSQTLTASLQVSAVATRYLGNTAAYGSSRYYQVAPALIWQVSRWWTVTTSIVHANVAYTASGASASSDIVYLTLRRNWPAFIVSR
ncbi:MAG: hypothetical protein ACYDAZ_08940, partial [Thermoplasmataceae archaeon]